MAPTPSRLSRPRSKTRRASPPTSSASSSPASSSKMAALSRITTSRRSPPCTWCLGSVEEARNKKKTYTKPKKIKHKKKKVKLHVLKYYTVDASDKVTRMRRECPHADCGAGVFMAQHFDR